MLLRRVAWFLSPSGGGEKFVCPSARGASDYFALEREPVFFACPKKTGEKKRHPAGDAGYASTLRSS